MSDILSLNIEDVKNKNYIEIKEKKTKKYKRFPLNDKLKKLIKSYLKIRMDKYYSVVEGEPLFLGKKHKRLDRSQVYRFLNEVCEDLNIKANIKPTKKNESEYTSGTSMLEIPLDYEGQPEAVIIYIRPKDFQEAGMII